MIGPLSLSLETASNSIMAQRFFTITSVPKGAPLKDPET